MKQLKLTCLLAVLMSMVGAKVYAWDAYDAESRCYFDLDNTTMEATVTYNQPNTESPTYFGQVFIPSTIVKDGKTYTVTAIGKHAFAFCPLLTNVEIPNTVKTIYDYAFQNAGLDRCM